jgi:hypothetical protein
MVSAGACVDEPPAIASLPDGAERPFWSVMVPVFNAREDYLRETLLSVLQQDPGIDEMQIEVIDNCSTNGDLAALIHQIGRGRIAFHRQSKNEGIVDNFNTCLRRGRGQWIHILHADDTVRPDFYKRARAGIEKYPDVGAVMCRFLYMDEDGQWTGLSELEARVPCVMDEDFAVRQFLDQRIQFVAFVVRRSTYEELGGFRAGLPHCLDWDKWKQIAVRKRIYYDPMPLACFRIHTAADSSRLIRSGANVVEERKSIEYSLAEVPPDRASRMRRLANRSAGIRAARRARLLWKDGQRLAACRQASQALRCSIASAVLLRSAYFVVYMLLHLRPEL